MEQPKLPIKTAKDAAMLKALTGLMVVIQSNKLQDSRTKAAMDAAYEALKLYGISFETYDPSSN